VKVVITLLRMSRSFSYLMLTDEDKDVEVEGGLLS